MIFLIETYKRLFDLYFKFYKEESGENKYDLCFYYQTKLFGMLTLMNESGVIDFEKYLYECNFLYEKFV